MVFINSTEYVLCVSETNYKNVNIVSEHGIYQINYYNLACVA